MVILIFQPGASSASSLLSKADLSKQVGYKPEQRIKKEILDFVESSKPNFPSRLVMNLRKRKTNLPSNYQTHKML